MKELSLKETRALNGGVIGGPDGETCTTIPDLRDIGTTGPYDPSPEFEI